MVVTRKRSVSSSEAGTASTGTPRAAKLKKQDDSGAGPAPRTTARCVDPSGTPFTATRRTRRLTDSVAEAVGSSPYNPRRATRSTRNPDTATPVKVPRTERSIDKAEDGDSSDGRRLPLRDIFAPTPPATKSSRSRRVSGGEADGHGTPVVGNAVKSLSSAPVSVAGTPSTPVRRSRRLSGSGVEEAASQEIPSELSFSIARIMGVEKKSKEEIANKQSSLPVIEEDAERQESENAGVASPKKETTETLVSEEEKIIITEEPIPEVQTTNDGNEDQHNSAVQAVSYSESGCLAFPVFAKKKEEPSEPAAPGKAAENEIKISEEQTADSNESDAKCDVLKNPGEGAEDPSRIISETAETREGQEASLVVNNVESSSDKLGMMPEEEEQNSTTTTSDPKEVVTYDTKPTDSEDKQESTPDIEVHKESCIAEETQVACSAPVDENYNTKVNGTGLSSSSQATVGGKITKVIPEMEKKIQQIRNIPKGRPISGRWWKKEKQRFRSINKDATGKKKWSKKMQIKQWREDVLSKSAAIEAEKKKKKEDLRERQKINKIRREENAKKAEIVQVIKDPRKIKKMKRKQLRHIETRDTTDLKQV